ncbi:DUF302 domain-containing protein [Amycolatopsis sp. NPDC004368]
MKYDLSITVNLRCRKAVGAVRAALEEQGSGVLTEIDVKATMHEKLDVDMEPYVILGACNPPLAHRALGTDRMIGLLLPSNVVVRADGDERSLVQPLDRAGASEQPWER